MKNPGDGLDVLRAGRRPADRLRHRSRPLQEVLLPLALAPGEEAWLDVDLPPSHDGLLLRPDGTQIRVTGWAGGECVGRVWVGDRPDFSGGDANVLWIPPGWSGLTLLVRGAAGLEVPELRVLWLESSD